MSMHGTFNHTAAFMGVTLFVAWMSSWRLRGICHCGPNVFKVKVMLLFLHMWNKNFVAAQGLDHYKETILRVRL